MPQKGAVVNYATTGVCTVEEIRRATMGGKEREYYVLRPLGRENSTVMVPGDNEELLSRMRSLLDKKELLGLLSADGFVPAEWEMDDRGRFASSTILLQKGTFKDLLKLVVSIENQSRGLRGSGKHLKSADNGVLNSAMFILSGEVAYTLGLSKEEAENRIDGFVMLALDK